MSFKYIYLNNVFCILIQLYDAVNLFIPEFVNTLKKKQSSGNTRGICKVLIIVFHLSNRFTNPIMFGIILKNYLSSMLLRKFYEDIVMQTQKISM